MKTVNQYLDEIKARYGLPSDYAVAKLLKISPANVTGYRKGKSGFDDERALIVAELLEIDPVIVLADMNAMRTKCPAARDVWERVARSTAAAVFAVFLAVFVFAGVPSPAQAATALQALEHCLLCQIGMRFSWRRRQLRGHFVRLLLALGLAAPGAATASDWTHADTLRETAYQLTAAMDWAQTRQIAKPGDRWQEGNPFLGAEPSGAHINKWFAAGAVAHAVISYALPPEYRRAWQYASIAFEGGFVAHNIQAGVRLEW